MKMITMLLTTVQRECLAPCTGCMGASNLQTPSYPHFTGEDGRLQEDKSCAKVMCQKAVVQAQMPAHCPRTAIDLWTLPYLSS